MYLPKNTLPNTTCHWLTRLVWLSLVWLSLKTKANAYKYTAKSNLVAVISNGTAVLGLGDIGADASKPVMEGKGLLFKIFAGIDVFDIEVDATDVDKFVETVKAIAPYFWRD